MRGLTLIELMITVALLGLGAVTVGGIVTQQRRQGVDALHRARADQLLAYSAQRAVHGERPDADVSARLMDGLPRASVKVVEAGATRTVTVRWGAGDSPHTRSLVVFAAKGKR